MNVINQSIIVATDLKPKKTNYSFIELYFPEIYQICEQIDYYYAKDHSCCLVKVRLFTELWCHEVCRIIKLKLHVNSELVNKIKQLESSGKVPPYIIEIVDSLRIESNKGVHIQRHVDGQFRASIQISTHKLKQVMLDVFELTKYLTLNLADIHEPTVGTWNEPEISDQAELIYQALQGNADASMAMATHFSQLLNKLDQQYQNNKVQYFQYQRDLAYWLDKAERQGSHDCWLLLATSAVNHHFATTDPQQINRYFKKAIKNDDTGNALWEFFHHLCRIGQHNRAQKYLEKAGYKGYSAALELLLNKYYQQDDILYQQWLKQSLIYNNNVALVADTFHKLDIWEADPNNEINFKILRTALIKSEAYQAPGAKFVRGYCEFYGLLGCEQDVDEGMRKMLIASDQLPDYLWYEKRLHEALKIHKSDDHKVLELYSKALLQTDNLQQKAQMKFEMAMIIIQLLKNTQRVKVPQNLKVMIRESVKEGCEAAKQFVISAYGKKFMRDNSYVCRKITHTKIDRNKQKKARKKAKQAKRK